MIYRETHWKRGGVAVVEVIPLAGQPLPEDFRRFRFRMAYQHILASGPVIKGCDIGLSADNVVQAIEEAEKLKPLKEIELQNALGAEVTRVLQSEANKAVGHNNVPDVPKLEEEGKVSEK